MRCLMIEFYQPHREDLWFKEQLLSDEATMSYNHAYGGTIEFPKERWAVWYERWIERPEGKRFYRYLRSEEVFVGEAAFRLEEDRGIYLADVIVYAPYRGRGFGRQALCLLCEEAQKRGITELYDEIASDNPSLRLFLSCGFEEVERSKKSVLVRKKLSPTENIMKYQKIENDTEKQAIARLILEDLTDWFGIGEAREAYIRDSAGKDFFCAFHEGQPVGFLYLQETGRDTVELAVMGVKKDFHRRGIGRTLVWMARDCACEKGYSFLQVKTVRMGKYREYDETNRFYLALGFKEFEVFPLLWDEKNPCQIYVMALR